MDSQPNVVLIVSDQHSPHFLGCAGESLLRTPYLDRLAGQGVRFEASYCASPLCVPSRMTFLTGRPCSDIGVWTNSCMLPSHVPTFAHSLTAAGYDTVLGGRMHFVGPDQRHGFQERIIGDVLSPLPGGPGPDLGDIPRATTGQSRAAVQTAGPGRTAYQAYDVAVTDACCDWLEKRDATPSDRPFCLVVGLVLPHCPFICPKTLYDEYYEQVDVPDVSSGYVAGLHPAMRRWRELRGVDQLSRDEIRRARAAYYGLVTFMDERIGRVLQTLRDSRFADDTVIVYISDHGEMAGEHGMWWKSSFYEGSARVPSIWAWPERFAQGARIDAVTSLLDLAPTLTDLTGAPDLPGCAGSTLRAFLQTGKTPADWRDTAYAENMPTNLKERPSRMLRSGPWKLNHYHGHERVQLFNLSEDPAELEDRGQDGRCAVVRAELHEQARRDWDGDAIERELRRRAEGIDLLRQWGRTMPADPSDFWRAPPGANVFPEE